MKVEHELQSVERMLKMINSLLDAPSVEYYGENAGLAAASALGITTSSAIEVDQSGAVITDSPLEEIQRRVTFIEEMKRTKHVSFAEASSCYFRDHAQDAPLSASATDRLSQ